MKMRFGRLRIQFDRRSNGSFKLTVEWHRVTPADCYLGWQPFCRVYFLQYSTKMSLQEGRISNCTTTH